MGQMSTPDIPKRLSIIFLWAEFSQRAPIPIVNILINTVYIVGGLWGTHSYSDSPKNKKETDYFRNGLLSLCLLVENMMTN